MLGVVTLVFLLIHIVPGDPVEVMLGESAQAADREALREALGLNQTLFSQWWHYIKGLMHADLGVSLHSRVEISHIIAQRLPATFQLAIAALAIAIVIALPLGMIAAWKVHTWWDKLAMGFSLLGVSIPNFWLGPLLILFFSLYLGWFPVSGRESFSAIILPAFTLGTALAAILARMVRASLLEILNEDYIRTARAKGLNNRAILWTHAMRNAALPITTIIGLQLGALLGGAVITEIIFSWPGIGYTLVEAIQRRDYPLVQASVLMVSLSYIIINRLTDLSYAYLDPRIRFAK